MALSASNFAIQATISNEPIPVPFPKREVVESKLSDPGQSELVVKFSTEKGRSAFYCVVTDSAGKHLDPNKLGLYNGGRFAAHGEFHVSAAPGPTRIQITSGPNYMPVEDDVALKPGVRTEVDYTLERWFSPESRGWYGGDNHVHAAHDQTGEIKTGLAYAALQARANGLSFVTQASSEFPFEDHLKLSTPDFILRRSLEDRQGQFAGHLNSPGVELPDADRKATMHAAMPASATTEWVHAHNAAIIHTHTMVPAHQLHWMGAAEAYSYSIAGTCPDAMDLDGEPSENLWFMVLNLENKVSCSGSTDAALERASSPAPGARRMYVHSDKFDYEHFVRGIRAGKLIATNAGPLFAFVEMDGHGVAETVPAGDHRLKLEIDSLHPIEKAELIHDGATVSSFDVKGRSGKTTIDATFHDDGDGWYVCRVHDLVGNWAVTSPIYVKGRIVKPKPFAASMIFEIGNFTRLSTLRPDYMAHFIATVSPSDPITKVELLKDAALVKAFTPDLGDHEEDGKTPVTETFGEYKPGWLWTPSPSEAKRFQADWDVKETGWYQVRATTRSGRIVTSDEIHWDASNPKSNETSSANLVSDRIEVHHWGYGESLPIAHLDPEADGWWYPDNIYFHMTTRFGDADWSQAYGDSAREAATFRKTGGLAAR